MTAMNEQQLRAAVDAEIRNSIGLYGGKLSQQRQKALYYYMMEPKGDLAPPDVPDRSQAVSSDVSDAVEWMLPSLLETFAANDKAVEFIGRGPDAEQQAEQATAYVNHVFYQQNPGFLILYTWFKDALLQKCGFLKVYWDTYDEQKREDYTGLTDGQLQMLLADKGVEPLGYQSTPDPMTGQTLHDISVKRVIGKGRVCVENVPPEEFMISRRAKTIADSPFVGHRLRRTVGELRAAGYKNLDGITDDASAWAKNAEDIERRTIYDDYGMLSERQEIAGDPSSRMVQLCECYLKIDYDGDGIQEWRKVTVAGDRVLDNEACDGPPFVSLCPVPIPHIFFGRSVADLAMESQRVKTSVLRAMLDGLYHSVNGRTQALEGQVNLDDLLTNRPGGTVRVKSIGAVAPLNEGRPDLNAGLQMLEQVESMKENRLGWTRYSQGTGADSLNKTATGMNIITNKADSRLKLIERIFAETGVKDLFWMILKLCSQHQDMPETVRINGQWTDVNPRGWAEKLDIKPDVGLGTGNKDQEIQHLTTLLQVQREALQINVATPENIYNATVRLTKALGMKQPEQFFTDPSQQPPQPPPPDPKLIDVQNKHDIEMQKLQLMREKLEAEITLKREEMVAKLGLQNENAAYGTLYPQAESEVEDVGTTEPNDAGDPGAAGPGAIQGQAGGGVPTAPPVPGMLHGAENGTAQPMGILPG